MRRRAGTSLLAAAATLAFAAVPAHGAVLSATADDPQGDGTRGAPADIEQVRTTFDPDAGRWVVTVRFWAPTEEERWAVVNATILTPGSSGACTEGGVGFGAIRTSSRPSATDAYGSAGNSQDPPDANGARGAMPMDSVTKTRSPDGRELTVEGTSTKLVGRTAGCVTVAMSYQRERVDALSPGARFPVATPDPGGDEPSDQPADPAPGGPRRPPAASATIRLAAGTTSLRVRRDNRITVRLRPFDVDLTGTALVRTRSTKVKLATASWSATAGREPVVRLRLTKAGRAHLRRHRRSRVRLVIAARVPASALVTRAFVLPLRRAS